MKCIIPLNRNFRAGFLFILIGLFATAQADDQPLGKDEDITTIEYFGPIKDSRRIHAINASYDHLIAKLDEKNLLLYVDVIATYATGDITQLEGSLDLEKVDYHNTAFGVGPGFLSSYRFYQKDQWSLHFNGAWNIILYNKRFPSGGDRYNFMVKVGSMLEYQLGKNRSLGINLLWTHVSNGQGLGNHNPSYEAKGIGFRLKGLF